MKSFNKLTGLSTEVSSDLLLEYRKESLVKEGAEIGAGKTDPVAGFYHLVQFWDKEPPEQISILLSQNEKICVSLGVEWSLFNEENSRDYLVAKLGDRGGQVYDLCNHPAMKSDFFRIAYL